METKDLGGQALGHEKGGNTVSGGNPARIQAARGRPQTSSLSPPPLLIATSAIRIRSKPKKINHLKLSNRHKTRVFWAAAALRRLSITVTPTRNGGQCASEPAPRSLIGPPVIRIHHKPPRISHLKISNRPKTHLPAGRLSRTTFRPPPPSSRQPSNPNRDTPRLESPPNPLFSSPNRFLIATIRRIRIPSFDFRLSPSLGIARSLAPASPASVGCFLPHRASLTSDFDRDSSGVVRPDSLFELLMRERN
jgi:hypothetical protein